MVYAISGQSAGRAVHGAGEPRELAGPDAVVVRRDQHDGRRAAGRRVLGERHGVALCGRADLGQHGRARAGGDDGLEQRPALGRRLQMELPRRAGKHEPVHAGVDQAPSERRGGVDVDLLAVVVEGE